MDYSLMIVFGFDRKARSECRRGVYDSAIAKGFCVYKRGLTEGGNRTIVADATREFNTITVA